MAAILQLWCYYSWLRAPVVFHALAQLCEALQWKWAKCFCLELVSSLIGTWLLLTMNLEECCCSQKGEDGSGWLGD